MRACESLVCVAKSGGMMAVERLRRKKSLYKEMASAPWKRDANHQQHTKSHTNKHHNFPSKITSSKPAMTISKVLDKLVHYHVKAYPEETQRDSVDSAAPLEPPVESAKPPSASIDQASTAPTTTQQLPTPPAESHHHTLLYKLVHPLEKSVQNEEAQYEKKHHHRHEDPIYLHHAIEVVGVPKDDSPVPPPHRPSSPLDKGWQTIKRLAHDHHESANESFEGYYGALTEGAMPTSPESRASVGVQTGRSEVAPKAGEEQNDLAHQPHGTKKHTTDRLDTIQREKHHRKHTMGYGVAVV